MEQIQNEATTLIQPESEMTEAIRAAKSSMRQFLEAFQNPEPQQTGFHLKVAFEVDHKVEHIWLCAIDLEHGMPTGVVANETHLPGFVLGMRVPFETVRVTDWMYTDDNAMVGGFTTRALLKMRLRLALSSQQMANGTKHVH